MYWVTVLILVVYVVLVWVLGRFLPLHGNDVWILRGVLLSLGLIGAGVALWYQHKIKKEKEAEAAGEGTVGPTAGDDVDTLVREAVRKLKGSTLGRGANLAGLPVVFLLGDSGSTKTTVLIHSALEPELLAGQVYRDNEIVPTATGNIWYTRQAIFVDPAGSMMGQADLWRRLVKLLQPGRFSSAVGKRVQAPRAALVCFDCENFLRQGASETAASAARKLATRLQEISQLSGISFPVYVLFTRLDRIAFFADFVRGMSKDEASEILGSTLPLRSLSAGVYADEETRRLTKAFDDIFYSLAERRILLLPREHENDKLPGIYEFPREMRKLRTLLVQFLVDLARPSQLTTNPFLRGFYFTGVRPVVVDDVVAAPVREEVAEPAFDAGATRIFSGVGSLAPAPQASVRTGGSRRVPQWVFLTGLFNDVLVKDRVALAASGSSSRINVLRRVALGTAVLIGVICLTGFGISFFRNRALESRVQEAVADLRAYQTAQNQIANIADLQKLDRLRGELAVLSDYDDNGAPFSLRWGLYTGDQIYPIAKQAYFQRFRQLLFAETQNRMVEDLRALPDKPGANDVYEPSYNELKAYLITTSNPEKSTKEFLSPVLQSHWVAGRDIDTDRKLLAAAQFDFYSTELVKANPFSSSNSKAAIEFGRAYLRQFAAGDRYYSGLLNGVEHENHAVSFPTFNNNQFKDAAEVVVNRVVVRGAFTKSGYLAVQKALQEPSNISAEEWVLGKVGADSMDPAKLQQELSQRYSKDFLATWNALLKQTNVVGYNSVQDAVGKLSKLSGPGSPLLGLFWFVAQNTDVPNDQLKKAFQPVQTVEAPGGDGTKIIQSGNENYIAALTGLKSALELLANSPNTSDPAVAAPALQAATDGKKAVGQLTSKFQLDPDFHIENQAQALLEAPLTNAEEFLKVVPAKGLAGAGASFCSGFAAMANKFPLRSDAVQELTIAELNAMFEPGKGALAAFYKDKLATFVTKQGSNYVANPGGSVRISPNFLSFLNRATAVSDALYPSGSAPPHFSYTLKQLPSNLEDVVLQIGSESLTGANEQKNFVWTGAPENVQVTSKGGSPEDSYNGPWAAFHFVRQAHQLGGGKLEWVLENNGRIIMLPNGKQKSYDYQLQTPGANPFFELPGMRCVGPVSGR